MSTYSEAALFNAIHQAIERKLKHLADNEIVLFIMLDQSGQIVRLQFVFDLEVFKILTTKDIYRLNEQIKSQVKFRMPTETIPYSQRMLIVRFNDLLNRQ